MKGTHSHKSSKSKTLISKFRKYSNQGFDYIYENPRMAGQARITKAQNSKRKTFSPEVAHFLDT